MHIEKKKLFYLASLCTLFFVQILPASAQNVPTNFAPHFVHAWTGTYVHQHDPSTQNQSTFMHWGHHQTSAAGLPVPQSTASNTNIAHTNNAATVVQPYTRTGVSLNLDLSSTVANLTAAYLPNTGLLNIQVGNTIMSVGAHSLLTPAEYLAANEVARTGQQTILIDSQGSASGGTAVIGQHLSSMLNNLVIPNGVTVIDLSKSGTLNLSGDITNDGNLYVSSRNPQVEDIVISANNIQTQGNLSDIIPAGTLPWLNAAASSSLELTLNAANGISNSGTISSAGTLNLTAGSTGITNTGLIVSNNKDINIGSSTSNTDINVNAAGGTFQATNGNINFRDASYTGSGNINLNGGNYISQNLNLYSGTGAVTGAVDQVTGQVNTYAGSDHFLANTSNLILGDNIITGDPTYANTGNITISGTISPIEAIAIIAGGNIVATASGSISVTGTAVTLIAGADITGGGGGGQTVTNVTPGVGSSVTIQFDNNFGGNIDFTAATASTAILTGGGNVILLANSSSATTGNIWFSTTTTSINTANSTGTGGTVQILAGGNGGTAQSGSISQTIQLGSIVTAAASQTGNTVSVTAAGPVITGGTATYDTHGVSVAVFTAGTSNGSINLGSINTSGTGGAAAVTVVAGGNITASGSITASNTQFTAASNITQTGGTIQSPIIKLTSTSGSVGSSSTPILLSNGGVTIGVTPTYFFASAVSGSIYLKDTADANVVLSNSSTNGGHATSTAGSVYSFTANGNIYGASNDTDTGLVIQAPTVLLSTSNGNIAQDSNNTFDTLQISGGGGGVTLFASASGSVAIADNTTENIILSTSDTHGTSTAGTTFDLSSASNIFASDTALAIKSPEITIQASGTVASNSSNAPLSISGVNGGGTSLQIFVSPGSVYLTDTVNETVTLETTGQAGFPVTAGSVFSLNASGSILASDNTQAIQAPEIFLVSNNGNIETNNTTTLLINNNGSGISKLYADAPTGVVNITDNDDEIVTLTTAATTGTSTAGTSFTLKTVSIISADTTGSTTINSPIVSLTSTGGGVIGPLNLATANITVNTNGNVTITDTTAITGTGNSTVGSLNLTDTAAGGMAITSNITATGGTISLTSNAALTNGASSTISAGTINTSAGGTTTIDGTLTATSTVSVISNGQIAVAASGTVHATHNVSIAALSSPDNVALQNNGVISSTSGLIGINGTSTGRISISGTGSISGGTGVNVGNLNSSTLQIQTPFTVVNPFTGTFTNQYGTIGIVQNSINQPLQVSNGPIPSTSSGSSTNGGSGFSAQQIFLYELALLQQRANNLLTEQIGTRIATDYTPWTTYPRVPIFYPLQGSVTRNELSAQALFAASEFNANELTALSSAGVVFGPQSSKSFLDLLQGNVVFAPASDIEVQVREGRVIIPAKTVAWVHETGHDATIYDFHDNWVTGVVKVIANNKVFSLSPGKELLLTRDTMADFAKLNPNNSLGYRNVGSTEIGDGIKVYVCDFSITNGAANIPILRDLIYSKDSVQKKLGHQILKNAAILADLMGNPEYKTVSQ